MTAVGLSSSKLPQTARRGLLTKTAPSQAAAAFSPYSCFSAQFVLFEAARNGVLSQALFRLCHRIAAAIPQ